MHSGIKSNLDYFKVFITDLNLEVNSKDVPLNSNRETIRKEISKLTNCVDYRKMSCSSLRQCRERCIQRTSLDTKKQAYLFNFRPLKYKKFLNYSIAFQIDLSSETKRCSRKFTKSDCRKVAYENEKTHIEYSKTTRIRIFQVYFVTITYEETRISRCYDLFLIAFNVVIVLFGVTSFNLYGLSLKLVELKYNLKKLKKNKYFGYFIKFGFISLLLIHCNLIYSNLFFNSFRNSLIIELKPHLSEFFEMPDINLCFDYKLNRSSFNGFDLDEHTQDLTIETIFESIKYFNGNSSIIWTPNSTSRENSSIFLSFDYFYFLNKKCFKIIHNYGRTRLPSNQKHPMKIILNKKLNRTYFYLCSNLSTKPNTLSRLNRLNFDLYYEVFLDRISLAYNDIIEGLKNPYLFWRKVKYRELESFIPFVKREFIIHANQTTRWLPLTKNIFKYNVNDELFAKFYKEKFEAEWLQYFSSNFKMHYIKDNILIDKSFRQSYNLKFNTEHLLSINEIEREEDFLSFLVSVINIISFWFALSIFRILYLILDFCGLIIKRKFYLKRIYTLKFKF